jgi:CelD/BcsL family acetyltransferase involved in cellulose biosynthesis
MWRSVDELSGSFDHSEQTAKRMNDLQMKHPVSVRIVDTAEAWDEIASEWTSLFHLSAAAATPLQFDWLRTWWRTYGVDAASKSRGGLRVFTFWRDATLVGALPLYESQSVTFGPRVLRFVSTGEAEYEETCPDYMDLLVAHGEQQGCLTAMVGALQKQAWDCIELLDIIEGSPLLNLSFENEKRRLVNPRGACPIANLEGGFDAYLQRVSASSRSRARRLLREADACGARLEIATAETFSTFYDDLVGLHQRRWTEQGKRGCFAAERFTAFHRSLVERWTGDGRAVLARLVLQGEPIAVLYGFVTRSKFDFYQSGTKMIKNGALRSPGTVAHLMLMRMLADRGVKRYDFLRGSSAYKTRLATDSVQLFAVTIWRSTRRTAAYDAARTMARAAWRAMPMSLRSRVRAHARE